MKEWVSKFKKFADKWHIPQLAIYWQRGNATMVGPTIAYYTIVSLVPLIMTIGSVVSLLGVDKAQIHEAIKMQMPIGVAHSIMPIVDSVLSGGVGTLSLSVIVAIWSASSILSTIRKAFNSIYGSSVQENGILTRVMSFIWMLVLLVASVVAIALNSILPAIAKMLPSVAGLDVVKHIASQGWLYSIIALVILLSLFNYLIPAEKMHWKPVVLGSILEILLIVTVNSLFGVYTNYALKKVSFYQSLSSLLVLLIYLNILAVIMVVAQVAIAWLTSLFEDRDFIHNK